MNKELRLFLSDHLFNEQSMNSKKFNEQISKKRTLSEHIEYKMNIH